jgi:integrase
VLDEAEQIELMSIAKERADLQMLEPLICGLHGVSGVDVREMLKGAYNAKTGILSGQRHKTGQAKFSVPIAPALRPYLDRHVVKLTHGSWMFPQFRTGKSGEPCDPKGRMDRMFQRLVSGTEFDGLTFYCLRHSFISLILAKAVPASQVALWAGHLDTKLTTTTYSHFLPDESVQQMEAIKLFEAVS